MSKLAQSGFYRQTVPDIELSLEQNTARLPPDGLFYVLHHGEIKGKFRSKKLALELYKTILTESGYSPPPTENTRQPIDQTVERYLDDLEAYWLDSHKHAKRGGSNVYRR